MNSLCLQVQEILLLECPARASIKNNKVIELSL